MLFDTSSSTGTLFGVALGPIEAVARIGVYSAALDDEKGAAPIEDSISLA